MIKTHKPRGYFWTHASAFQQTKEFRDVSYEESAAPTSRALAQDPDETLSNGARQRKRRRIEKLADDFLNGETLFIASARPCPERLRSTIAWNQKSSADPKFEFSQACVPNEPTILWHDVDDDDEALHSYRAQLQQPHINGDVDQGSPTAPPISEDHPEAVLRAVSRATRRYNSADIRSGPSSDAVRKAAALRVRRAQRLEIEVVPVAQLDDGSGRRLRSSDKRTGSVPNDPWLSRRPTVKAAPSSVDNEESLDELRLSRIETPSHPPKGPRSSALSQSVAQLATSRKSQPNQDADIDPNTIVVTPRIDETSTLQPEESLEPRAASAVDAHSTCLESNSYHTANEETAGHHTASEMEDEHKSQDDSQTRLLRSQGFAGASASSWRAVNQKQQAHDVTPAHANDVSQVGLSAMSAKSILPELQSEGRNTRRSGRLASKSSVHQPQSDEQQRPAVRSRRQVAYKSDQATTNCVSPFKWRRKVTFPSSDEIIVGKRPEPPKGLHDRNTSQSAPVTPAATAVQHSNSKKVTAKTVDVVHSSPVLTSHTPAARGGRVSAAQQSLPETWIGTQAMLFQAQRDLITSPEKPAETPLPAAADDGSHNAKGPRAPLSQKSDREPLKQLSQEPMPSTQALIGDFVGFSTVKKPWRSGPRESIDSPSVLLRAKPTTSKSTGTVTPDPSHDVPLGDKSARGSRFQFSMESVEPPLRSTNIDEPHATGSPINQRGADWSSTDIAISANKSSSTNAGAQTSSNDQRDPTTTVGEEAPLVGNEFQSMESFTSAALPSFQAAQQAGEGWSSLPRNDSDIDATIEELTTYVLDQTDIEGVLSQVG